MGKKNAGKEGFNSSLNFHSKAMYSGLPLWLLFPSLPYATGEDPAW